MGPKLAKDRGVTSEVETPKTLASKHSLIAIKGCSKYTKLAKDFFSPKYTLHVIYTI